MTRDGPYGKDLGRVELIDLRDFERNLSFVGILWKLFDRLGQCPPVDISVDVEAFSICRNEFDGRGIGSEAPSGVFTAGLPGPREWRHSGVNSG